MAKYRKKPVVIEAYQWTQADQDSPPKREEYWPGWLYEAYNAPLARPGALFRVRSGTEGPRTLIHTLEGGHEVRVGDWIIRGIAGELYPCKPEIFTETYEAVDE